MIVERLLRHIRGSGWMVVCHNDYRLNGELFTFWSFARDNEYVKGEGRTDEEALHHCASIMYAKRVGWIVISVNGYLNTDFAWQELREGAMIFGTLDAAHRLVAVRGINKYSTGHSLV